jgi:hypothetical protein
VSWPSYMREHARGRGKGGRGGGGEGEAEPSLSLSLALSPSSLSLGPPLLLTPEPLSGRVCRAPDAAAAAAGGDAGRPAPPGPARPDGAGALIPTTRKAAGDSDCCRPPATRTGDCRRRRRQPTRAAGVATAAATLVKRGLAGRRAWDIRVAEISESTGFRVNGKSESARRRDRPAAGAGAAVTQDLKALISATVRLPVTRRARPALRRRRTPSRTPRRRA